MRLSKNVWAGVLFAISVAFAAAAVIPAPGSAVAASPGAGPAAVIAYAKAQIGKPYLWGGTGPAAFDCSGLAMMAYQAAEIAIERTSQDQWASEPQVPADEVKPGDLVFFPGSDGTPTSPGHVGIVVDPATDQMIDAYAAGTPVGYDTYGPAASRPGLSEVSGFTQPW